MNSQGYTDILNRLNAVRLKENRLELTYAALVGTGMALGIILFAVLLEQFIGFGTTGRTFLFILTLLLLAGIFAWKLGKPLLRTLGVLKSESNKDSALKVGKYFPSIKDRLLDALQMYEGRHALRQNYSVELIDASFADLYTAIRPLDFTEAISHPRIRRVQKYVGYVVGVAVLIFVVSPSGFLGSLYRIANYNKTFAEPLPIKFMVEPGNIEAVRGQTVPITIRTEGKPVQTLSLSMRQQGEVNFDKLNLSPNQPGEFRTEIASIKASTEYFASVDDISSERFNIKVLDRPLIRSLEVMVKPPGYTRLPARTLEENAADITAFPGSTINLKLTSSKPLAKATVVFRDSSKVTMNPAKLVAGGSFAVRKNTSYHVALVDEDGLSNIDPVEYSIKTLVDEFPTVEILSPAKNVDLTEDMKLDLFIRFKDDFGFSKLRLAYRLTQSRYEQPSEEHTYINIPITQRHQSPQDARYFWDLAPLNLVPEDAIAYYVEVFDNDNVSGPKSGRSETFIVRLPSLEEVLTDVSESHELSIESMRDVAKETEQLKKDIDDMQREMKKGREKMDWQQQKKAEEMVQRYEAMKKKLEETSARMDEAVKKMDENKLLSEQTMQKYQEMQKLMEQLNSPELREALKKLQEMMKQQQPQLSPDQMQKAMEQLKASEEQFRKSLERTLELLRRIHIEQKLDELIKRAEELQKQQEQLRQETAKTNPSDQQKRNELSQKQQDLQKQMQSLEKETADLQKKMEEFAKEMPIEEMAKAQEQLQKNQTGQKMQKSAQQMQSGDMQSAQQNQQQSEQDLSEFQQQMQQAQKSLQEKQMKQVVNEMRKQVQNLVELSKRQEELKDETRQLDPNSQRFRENAQEQHDVMSDLNNVANQMAELSKKTFAITPEMGKEMGKAMQQMNDAMKGMEGRNPGEASDNQSEAMASLNRAAMMMQNTLGQMMQGGQSGMGMAGLMARLGQMAGAQGGLNQATQQAMGQGQGGEQGISAEQAAEYQRLGGQQAALQKSLEQLSQEAKNAGEFSKLMGDLDRVAEDMKEVQTDLQQGNVNPETIQKQERILSRLLDSQRSMRERDYEKRRRADVGKNMARTSPGEIDLSTQEGRNRLRDEMLKVREGSFSRDYEDLILKYFEQLEKADVEQQQ